jgi:hypothetical protein
MISIRIKTTNSSKEIALTVAGSSKVDEIKRLVMIELGLVGQEDKYVRLISCGKMLADGNTLATYNVTNGAFIHAVISDKKPNSGINNGIEMTTMNSSSISNQYINLNGLVGLDALLSEGLSVDEVAAIRSYFRTSIDEYASRDDRLQIREGENNVAYRARIEEAWMNAQPPHSEFILNLPLDSPRRLGLGSMSGSRTNPLLLSFIRGFVNQNRENRENMMNNNNSVMVTNDESLGSTRDFVFGIFFGVFFGFMSLLCVWDHNIPFRQKVGILIGVMIQLIMGTLVNSPNAASTPTNTNSNSNSNNNNNSVNNAINGLEQPLPTGN